MALKRSLNQSKQYRRTVAGTQTIDTGSAKLALSINRFQKAKRLNLNTSV